MKHFFKLTCAAAILTIGIFALSFFTKEKKTTVNGRYQVELVSQKF